MTRKLILKVVVVVVVVVCIFRYFHLYLQKSIKKKKTEEAEPQGQALAKRTCRGGQNEQAEKNVIKKEKRAMQAGSEGHIGRVEKQLGLNLQGGGGMLKLYWEICENVIIS